jgi:perosamine synthetase
MDLAQQIARIESMSEFRIPLSSPDITEAEIQAVVDVMRTRHLSLGPKGPEFEHAFEKYLGVDHAIAVSSGTAGLHAALLALGIGPGDEVVTTPFSFIASSNVIMMVGARPVFADIDPQSLNMDVEKAAKLIGPKTKAILGVEAFGNPEGMHEASRLAARHEIPLIEDCCEALGSAYKKRKCGTFGRVGVFGFYPNKQITTGEGGMIVTNDERLAELCKSLRNQGRDPGGSWLAHARLGYNYRLSDMNCAMGIVQMERLEEILAKRERVAHSYVNHLMDSRHIILPTIGHDTEMSWFVFVVRLTDTFSAADRDAIIAGMRGRGIGCSNYFPPIHLQPFYAKEFGYKRGDFPITEYVSDRTLALPFHNNLTDTDVETVVHHLNEVVASVLGKKGQGARGD